MREMCKTCPFNPQSITFKYRDGWVKNIEEEFAKKGIPLQTRGCHNLQDTHDPKPENICIGHRDWLKPK